MKTDAGLEEWVGQRVHRRALSTTKSTAVAIVPYRPPVFVRGLPPEGPFGRIRRIESNPRAAAMSIELVNGEIAGFLASAEPAVLCLRGRWGVGKTYAWNEQLAAAKRSGRLALKNYAYVSLFGVNSLDALKFAILEGSPTPEKATVSKRRGKNSTIRSRTTRTPCSAEF